MNNETCLATAEALLPIELWCVKLNFRRQAGADSGFETRGTWREVKRLRRVRC